MADTPTYHNALTPGSILNEYRLESVLGAGGFGMTYLAWDGNLEKHVAIKEYLPVDLAVRALDGSIVPVNTESDHNYKWGLDRFVKEARTLARFSHPNIVRVNRYFEANGTSYMVMDYEAGESFHQYLKRNPAPAEVWLRQIMMPILDGLQAVHKAGFLHRDIKPSNVFIRENGAPVLLDFGSARLAIGAVSRSLTAIVSPGYAPLEQYTVDGNQGPWTDIYALAAVMYRAVTGENPPDAVKRMREDSVTASLAVVRGRYDERFLRAIEWGLSVEERVRPKDVEEWRELLSGRAPVTALDSAPQTAGVRAADRSDPASTPLPATHHPPVAPAPRPPPRTRWKWLRRGAFVCALLAAGAIFMKQRAVEKGGQQAVAQPQTAELAPQREQGMAPRSEAVDAGSALSRAEFAQRLPAYAGRFAEVDGNGDGMVSMSELTAFMQKEGLADESRDSERRPLAPAQVPPPAAVVVAVPSSVQQEFVAADRDGNGYLSPAEVRGRFPFIERNFSLVDSDGDGRISLSELAELRKRQKLQEPRP